MSSSSSRCWLVLCALSLVGGCGGGPAPSDAGSSSIDSGSCAHDTDCDDGLYCNGTERCVEGACMSGATPSCDDSVACTTDACSETRSACVHHVVDADHDGHGVMSCVDVHGAPLGDDCDDTDPNRFPGNHEICDAAHHDEDCDPTTHGGVDADGDGHEDARCCNASACGDDCNDAAASAHPGASEACNAIDDDCDAMIDEGVTTSLHVDADADGHGAVGSPAVPRCATTAGWAVDATDCNDHDLAVGPSAPELCDNVDNDCDTTVDEDTVIVTWYRDADGDGYGSASGATISACTRQAGYSTAPTDCDDTAASRSPAAPELCNAIDDDCNGLPDYVIAPGNLEDDDLDHIADAMCGPPLGRDCDDLDPNAGPGHAESCNGRDDDCDGLVDENAAQTAYYVDHDGDGYGASNGAVVVACSAPSGTVALGGDCDDGNPEVAPGDPEACNGVDDDCDGTVDEGEAQTGCRTSHAIAQCLAGRCQVLSCTAPYANCDTNPDCEANFATGATCGSCTNMCPRAGDLCGTGNLCAPIPQAWSASVDSFGGDGIANVIAGPGGTLITGGGHGYPVTVNGASVPGGPGGQDGWVGAFSPLGALQWFTEVGSPGSDQIYAVTTDPASTMTFYAAGEYGPGAPSGFVGPSVTAQSGFVLRFDASNGTPNAPALMFQSTSGSSIVWAMHADATGFTVVGWYTNDVNIPAASQTPGANLPNAVGAADAFVARYSVGQFLVWSRQIGGDGEDRIFGLDVDASGNTYIAIQSDSTSLTVGGMSAPRLGMHDVAVAALGPSGAPMWLRRFGSLGDDSTGELVVGGGRVFVSAGVTSNATFGSGPPVPGYGTLDAAVVALDAANGSTIWARTFGTSDFDSGYSIELARNQVYVGLGSGHGTMQIGDASYTTNGHAIVVSLTTDGEVRWSEMYGTGAAGQGAWPVGFDYLGGSTLYVRSVWSGQFDFFGAAVNGYQVDQALNAFDLGPEG